MRKIASKNDSKHTIQIWLKEFFRPPFLDFCARCRNSRNRFKLPPQIVWLTVVAKFFDSEGCTDWDEKVKCPHKICANHYEFKPDAILKIKKSKLGIRLIFDSKKIYSYANEFEYHEGNRKVSAVLFVVIHIGADKFRIIPKFFKDYPHIYFIHSHHLAYNGMRSPIYGGNFKRNATLADFINYYDTVTASQN